MTTQLPVITGAPKVLKRKIKPYQRLDLIYTCELGKDCPRSDRDRYNWKEETGEHQHRQKCPDGAGYLERKASGELVYHTPWIKKYKPFELNNPIARVEKPDKAWKRLLKDCRTPVLERPQDRWTEQVGKSCPDGFKIAATNGHWALLEKGEGTGSPLVFMGIPKGAHSTVIEDPEFYLTIKRSATMADERSNSVCLFGHEGAITAYSSSSDYGDFTESTPAMVTQDWETCFNIAYLLLPLGTWPIRFWVKNGESAVVIEPANDPNWRFVVMPMRADLDHARKQID